MLSNVMPLYENNCIFQDQKHIMTGVTWSYVFGSFVHARLLGRQLRSCGRCCIYSVVVARVTGLWKTLLCTCERTRI